MYGVVLYRTAQAMPGTCCSTYGPYSSTQKLLNAIDNLELELTGGKSESYANMAMVCIAGFLYGREFVWQGICIAGDVGGVELLR